MRMCEYISAPKKKKIFYILFMFFIHKDIHTIQYTLHLLLVRVWKMRFAMWWMWALCFMYTRNFLLMKDAVIICDVIKVEEEIYGISKVLENLCVIHFKLNQVGKKVIKVTEPISKIRLSFGPRKSLTYIPYPLCFITKYTKRRKLSTCIPSNFSVYNRSRASNFQYEICF